MPLPSSTYTELVTTTLDNYRSFTERHLIPFFGSKRITEITAVSIEDFIEARLGTNRTTNRTTGAA